MTFFKHLNSVCGIVVACSSADRACGGEAIIRFSEQDNHNREWEGVSVAPAKMGLASSQPTNMGYFGAISV